MEWTIYEIKKKKKNIKKIKQDVNYHEQIEYLEGLLEKAKQNANPDKD